MTDPNFEIYQHFIKEKFDIGQICISLCLLSKQPCKSFNKGIEQQQL